MSPLQRLRRMAPAALAGAAALAVALPAPADPSPGSARAARTPSAHLQVTEVEYRLALSRGSVRAGPLRLEVLDRGQDPHDLHIRALGGGRRSATPELLPGQRWDGVLRLRPGVYRLWCALPEHAQLGMRATLRVRR